MAVLSFAYVYLTVHLVLFIYHFNLRTHLNSMNIEQMRQHMISPDILPTIFTVGLENSLSVSPRNDLFIERVLTSIPQRSSL